MCLNVLEALSNSNVWICISFVFVWFDTFENSNTYFWIILNSMLLLFTNRPWWSCGRTCSSSRSCRQFAVEAAICSSGALAAYCLLFVACCACTCNHVAFCLLFCVLVAGCLLFAVSGCFLLVANWFCCILFRCCLLPAICLLLISLVAIMFCFRALFAGCVCWFFVAADLLLAICLLLSAKLLFVRFSPWFTVSAVDCFRVLFAVVHRFCR